MLGYLSAQQNSNAELTTDLRYVACPSFVAECCRARNDAQFTQLREVVDDSRRDAVAQILRLRVAPGIFKWENNYGIEELRC